MLLFTLWFMCLMDHLSFSIMLYNFLLHWIHIDFSLLMLMMLFWTNSLLWILYLSWNSFLVTLLLLHYVAFYWHSVIIDYLYDSLVFFLNFLSFLPLLLSYLLYQSCRKSFPLIKNFGMISHFVINWLQLLNFMVFFMKIMAFLKCRIFLLNIRNMMRRNYLKLLGGMRILRILPWSLRVKSRVPFEITLICLLLGFLQYLIPQPVRLAWLV